MTTDHLTLAEHLTIISRMPATIAGIKRDLTVHTPGNETLPVFMASFRTTSAKRVRTFMGSDFPEDGQVGLPIDLNPSSLPEDGQVAIF